MKLKMILFYVHECFACVHVCAPCACLVPVEASRQHQILWGCSGVAMWVGLRSSGRTAGAFTVEASLQVHTKTQFLKRLSAQKLT